MTVKTPEIEPKAEKDQKAAPVTDASLPSAPAALPVSEKNPGTETSGEKIWSKDSVTSEKSWGDKYAGKFVGFIKHFVINYAFNAVGSATLAYKFDKNISEKHILPRIESLATRIGKSEDKLLYQATYWAGNFFTRAQILLMGGHFLTPIMKWMSDHHKELEYKASCFLDSMQEKLGMGSAATQRNKKEYAHIEELKAKKTEMKPGELLLSDDDKRILRRHNMNEWLEFDETVQPWKSVIKARLMGILSSSIVNISLGLLSTKKLGTPLKDYVGPQTNRAGQPKEEFGYALAETAAGKFLDTNVLSKVPFFSSAIREGAIWAKYTVNDAILTLASALAFHSTEKKEEKKRAALAALKANNHANAKKTADDGITTEDLAKMRDQKPASAVAREEKREEAREAAPQLAFAGV